ncbi:unnamed protein product, partial [Allacma fusca]
MNLILDAQWSCLKLEGHIRLLHQPSSRFYLHFEFTMGAKKVSTQRHQRFNEDGPKLLPHPKTSRQTTIEDYYGS